MKSSHKKDKVLNNCVDPRLGLHIMKILIGKLQQKTLSQFTEEELILLEEDGQA